jgi:hypothetical protein
MIDDIVKGSTAMVFIEPHTKTQGTTLGTFRANTASCVKFASLLVGLINLGPPVNVDG